MHLSFVILTCNSEKYISACLDSIESSLPSGTEREIFVVDNGSKDKTREILDYKKGVITIKLERNCGTTYSRNLALRKATGDYIVVMDSDIVIKRVDWSALIKAFGPKVGLIAPRLSLEGGECQNSVKRFPKFHWRLAKLKNIFLGLPVQDLELYPELTAVKFPDTAISAFWVFKRELLCSVGLFDEKIFYSPEDVDYCVRVWEQGYSIKYFQDAEILHFTQQIAHKHPFSLISISFFLNFIYFFWKHGYWFNTKRIDEMKATVLRIVN